MSRSRKRWLTIGLISGALVLIPCGYHWWLSVAANAFISELKARGEPMDLSQVVPPPTPSEKNAATFITNLIYGPSIQNAATTNPPSGKQMIAPGKAMVAWRQPEIRSASYATNSWEEQRQGLAELQNKLNSLRTLFERPVLDFNLDYSQRANLTFRHLAMMKSWAGWLSDSAICELHQGLAPEACKDARAILAIAKGQTDERIVLSQIVRFGVAQIAANTAWEILQYTNLADVDLAQLQSDWQSLEFIAPLERAFLVERLFKMQTFTEVRNTPIYKFFDSDPWSQWSKIQWRWFWSYSDEVRGLRVFQALIEATRMCETNATFSAGIVYVHTNFSLLGVKVSDPDEVRIDFDENDLPGLFTIGVSESFKWLRRAMDAEITRRIVVTAIALKRFEAQHHELPVMLDELKPDFLSSVPIDPVDGQPLRYRQNPDETFLLYSIGLDGIDDGGNPEQKDSRHFANWQSGRDCVWPSAATDEEVHNYENQIATRQY